MKRLQSKGRDEILDIVSSAESYDWRNQSCIVVDEAREFACRKLWRRLQIGLSMEEMIVLGDSKTCWWSLVLHSVQIQYMVVWIASRIRRIKSLFLRSERYLHDPLKLMGLYIIRPKLSDKAERLKHTTNTLPKTRRR